MCEVKVYKPMSSSLWGHSTLQQLQSTWVKAIGKSYTCLKIFWEDQEYT